jgi:hypothetical protein
MIVSNCCGYPIYENTDICTACGEHCELIEEEELEVEPEEIE